MNLIEETEDYLRYEDDTTIFTKYKKGCQSTTLKHPPSFHIGKEENLGNSPCLYCLKESIKLI